ncbi:hypothetical protein PFISCL1PPCAC_14541, partial [Pristionchus fissidentatus]
SFDWVSIFCPPSCVSHPFLDPLFLIFCVSEYRLTEISYSESLERSSECHYWFVPDYLILLFLKTFISVSSLLVNLILLRILFTSKRREMGFYRILVSIFACSDIYYTIVHWVIPEMYGNAFIMAGHGVVDSLMGPCIYAAAYVQAFPILVFHFIYRAVTIISRFSAAMLWSPDEESLAILSPLFSGNISSPVIHNIETASNHLQAVYWAGETYSLPRWKNLLGASLLLILIIPSYIIIIYCAVVINKFLKMNARSERTLKLHRQLFKTLIYQTIYPLITTYY